MSIYVIAEAIIGVIAGILIAVLTKKSEGVVYNKLDKAGRITLTKDHLNRAGITKEVVLVGNFDHIEIWDKDTYYNMDKYSDENFEANAQFISAQRKGM